jgi:hypothetical protein
MTYLKWVSDVGEGWHPVVKKAVDEIIARGGTILQVKEKFGGLRLYCQGDEDVYDIALAAEKACESICEFCGKPGTLRTGGWLKTRCNECQAKHEIEHD